MTIETVTFHIPESIKKGLASGQFELFGGVVREHGRIVKMLDPVMKASKALKRTRYAVLAIAVVAVVGGVLFVSARATRKARIARRLRALDDKLRTYVGSSSAAELSREQLAELRAAIDEFLRRAGDGDSLRVAVDKERLRDLLSFAAALRAFSSELTTRIPSDESVPALPKSPEPKIVPVLSAISEQLGYQQRHWPA